MYTCAVRVIGFGRLRLIENLFEKLKYIKFFIYSKNKKWKR